MTTISAIMESNPKRATESVQSYGRRLLKYGQQAWHDDAFLIAENILRKYVEKSDKKTASIMADVLIDLDSMRAMHRELQHIDE